MFKVSKKKKQQNPNRTTCQIYSKLAIKTPEQCLVLLLLTLNNFALYFTVLIAEFEQKMLVRPEKIEF